MHIFTQKGTGLCVHTQIYARTYIEHTNIQTDRHACIHTCRQTKRTDRQTSRQTTTDRQTGRQAGRQTGRQTTRRSMMDAYAMHYLSSHDLVFILNDCHASTLNLSSTLLIAPYTRPCQWRPRGAMRTPRRPRPLSVDDGVSRRLQYRFDRI